MHIYILLIKGGINIKIFFNFYNVKFEFLILFIYIYLLTAKVPSPIFLSLI